MPNQDNRSTVSSQVWIKSNPTVDDKIKNNSIKHFDKYTSTERALINLYLSFYNSGMPIFASNGHWASSLGVSRKSVERAKRRLVRDGVIASNYRMWNTCLVKVSSFFLNPGVRKQLSYFFPALKVLPLAALLSCPLAAQENIQKTSQNGYIKHAHRRNVRHINIKVYNKDINLTLSSGVTNVQGQAEDSAFPKWLQGEKKDFSVGNIAAGMLLDLSKKVGIEMESAKSTSTTDRGLIEPEVLKITELPLTRWGQIRLCAFDGPTIIHARLNFNKSLSGQSAYASLFREALLYCRRNNIEPDFRRIEYLGKRFKVPDNPSMVLPSKVEKIEIEPTRVITTPPKVTTRTHKRELRRPESKEYIPEDVSNFDSELVFDRFEQAKKTNGRLADNLLRLGLAPDWNPMKAAIKKE